MYRWLSEAVAISTFQSTNSVSVDHLTGILLVKIINQEGFVYNYRNQELTSLNGFFD